MTDISVIKMIISVAVWRIYPSWVNDRLRAWEGLGHSRMFWARLSRDDFRSKLKIISFLSRDMSASMIFLFPALFERFGAKSSSSGVFGFDDVLEVFSKTPLRHRAFLRTTTTTTSIFWKFPFFSPKQSRFYWPDSYGDPQADQSTLVMACRKLEWQNWLPGVGEIERRTTIDRRYDWYESCAVIHGQNEKNKTKKKKQKKNKKVSVWLCEVSTLHHLQTSEFWGACFRDPMLLPSCTSLSYRVRGCTAAGWSGCSVGKAKESTHPWHFRCWSPRSNELECTDLVHWTGALHRFSSGDAIIVVVVRRPKWGKHSKTESCWYRRVNEQFLQKWLRKSKRNLVGKKARTQEWVIVTYGRFFFDRRTPRITKATCTFWSQPKARETL